MSDENSDKHTDFLRTLSLPFAIDTRLQKEERNHIANYAKLFKEAVEKSNLVDSTNFTLNMPNSEAASNAEKAFLHHLKYLGYLVKDNDVYMPDSSMIIKSYTVSWREVQ